MPVKHTSNVDYPHKRPRLETSTKFLTASQIRAALHTDNAEFLTEGLTSLRNQLTIRPQQSSISPQDERLNLVKLWIESTPGAHDLFGIWDKNQLSLTALVLSLLSSVLELLSAHYNNHPLGQPIMKILLSPTRLRHLNSFIGGSNNELIIVTLKLFNAMSAFGGGRDRKSVLEGFGWEIKSLPKLLNMRRRSHGEKDLTDPLQRPDIRTLYILLLLSFVETDNSTQIKAIFLEQHSEAFLAIFKGLAQDHYSLAKKMLEVCWAGIWSDAKLKRTLKVTLFNESTLGHLIRLYERILPENADNDHVPANLVHHFLLAVCTRPGAGVCFKDRGWYHREPEPDDVTSKDDNGHKGRPRKIYNKILANILKSLRVNEDSRQQELAIKILSACPELVAGYWSTVALTLEPRLSSKWITNIAILGNIISLPVPCSSFLLPNTRLYQPTPPPLSTIMENILPSVNTKNNFSKGLQAPSRLVQHSTALALCKCLVKYRTIQDQFRKIASVLEEDEEEGQWYKRCRELEREARRRVPDFQVLVAFSQQKHADPKSGQAGQTKVALLAESAQRLLWLYHRCLPSVVAEVRFDVGKLLHTFSQEAPVENEGTEGVSDVPSKLYRLQQLHVLSLLKDSDQFVWSNKIASLSHSPLHILLTTLSSTITPAICTAIDGLLQHILSHSILFQEDPNEPELWLKSLPRKPAVLGAEPSTPQNETNTVILFLDECVQRCLKTPYRYVEALHALGLGNTNSGQYERLDMYPSPLLMTLIEQLDAKIRNKTLTFPQVIGIISFSRKLVVNLASKTSTLQFLHKYTERVDETLHMERLLEAEPPVATAIRREVDLLRACLSFSPVMLPSTPSDPEVPRYLEEAERKNIPETNELRTAVSLELVVWMRTMIHPLPTPALKRLMTLIIANDPSVLPLAIQNLVPGQTNIWKALDLVSQFPFLRPYISFASLYLNTCDEEIVDEKCQTILSESLFTYPPKLVDLSRSVHLIMHRVAASRQRHEVLNGHFSILASIFKASNDVLFLADRDALKELVFTHPNILKDVMMSPLPPVLLKGINRLLVAAVDPNLTNDRGYVSDISKYWLTTLTAGVDNQGTDLVSTACVWIKYLKAGQLFDLLDLLETQPHNNVSTLAINSVLEAMCSITSFEWEAELTLLERLPQLFSLRSNMNFRESPLLETVIAIAIEASLPIGLDGSPLPVNDLKNLAGQSDARWLRRDKAVNIQYDITSFLTQPTFSTSTVRIICGLIYRQSYPQEILLDWIQSADCLQKRTEYVLPILQAFLDTSGAPCSICLPFICKIVDIITDDTTPAELRRRAQHWLTTIMSTSDPSLIDALGKSLSEKTVSSDLILAARNLGSNPVLASLVEKGMQLCIDQFAGLGESAESIQLAERLNALMQGVSTSKIHLVETLLSVVVQDRFCSVTALRLAMSCLSICQLKPAVVNRYLQNIIQHPHFFKVCLGSSQEFLEVRDTLVQLIHCLFNLHPTNTCQITHIEPLIKIYRGTTSSSDLRILSIFQLFEMQKKLSVTVLFSRWSSAASISSITSLDAIQSLDPIIVLRTCLDFPRWRRVEDQSHIAVDVQAGLLYDPVFLMLLFSQMLSEQPPTSAIGCIELFRTNLVSLFIRALSSKDGQIRDLALCQVVGLWKHIQTADFQEQPHVLYILNLLKDLMPPPVSSEPPRRLPTYTTLLLMHSLRAVFQPSNFIYPVTARFLLQRPSLDIADVPMLFSLLYSSSDDHWKKERAWIIKFLADGMASSEDWRVLQRRHTWDLLASLFQSSEDGTLRVAILEVLANLTCNNQAATSLILKSSLLTWIEMQVLHSTAKNEGVEWVKILENIIVIVDAAKMEVVTKGEWRVVICRCLRNLLDEKTCTTANENMLHAVPVILRLSALSGPTLTELPSLLDLAVDLLLKLESTAQFDPFSSEVIPCPPHHSLTIHQRLSNIHYPQYIEMLWKASMSLDRRSGSWEKLTPRILLWGCMDRDRIAGDTAKWVRKEVVLSLQKS